METILQIDLPIDFNTMDETGLPWTFLDEATDPKRVVPGAHLVAGSGEVRAVVVIVDVTEDGIVHVCAVPGSVTDNEYLLEGPSAGMGAASERLPDLSPDSTEAGGTGRDQTEPTKPGTPTGTRPDGTRRHRPGRDSSNS